MTPNDETALVEAQKLAAYFIEAEAGQIVRDMARHVGDEIHTVLKRHGMTMTTTAGAIGVGVLAGVQMLNDTLEFALRSVDTEDERTSIAAGIAELIRSESDDRLAALSSLARREEGEETVSDAMIEAGHAEYLRLKKEGGYPLGYQHKSIYLAMRGLATRPPAPEDDARVEQFAENAKSPDVVERVQKLRREQQIKCGPVEYHHGYDQAINDVIAVLSRPEIGAGTRDEGEA